jgi:hypothetical protein
MVIEREYDLDPTKELFTITIAKGHHLTACNHLATYNADGGHRFPALHPIIDMFLRKKVRGTVGTRHHTVFSDIEEELKVHLRETQALHCLFPAAPSSYQFGDNSRQKVCPHALNYAHVASLQGYRDAQRMPERTLARAKVRHQYEMVQQTNRVWTSVDHMMVEDGHSQNGNHRIEAHTAKQIKDKIAIYNNMFKTDNAISSSTTKDSGVSAMYETFKEQNLFARWERMLLGTDHPKYENLKPFEWNMVGLLYRERPVNEQNESRKKRKQADLVPVWEEGDFPEDPDPKNLPFEFVAVYASLFSLMTSVKAWGTRRISGSVQICADNMYDCLKGVPNMYWFNTGITDAKGVHFPIVNALTLGRRPPRNEVCMRVGQTYCNLHWACLTFTLFIASL